ncbi:MAG: Diguanylate cyclase/phosphodiesterase [Ilumatobacteraceae bacterium]|nr:Diguanylate cyclase/phosphodiesterase [Ilumatobacteraceae bacterium]
MRSWYAVAALLGVLGAGTLFGLAVLRRQAEYRVRGSAIETASVVAALTVHRNVSEIDFGAAGGLTSTEVADLDADVAALIKDRRLVGLEVWRSDGFLVYADRGHPAGETTLPADQLVRVNASVPWFAAHATDRGLATAEVFLPYDAGTDGVVDGLVEVLIPDADINQELASTSRTLYVLAGSLVAVSALGLLRLRRRLVRREFEATHDRLTGLTNWGGFRDAVRAAIDSHAVTRDRPGAVLLVDLDGFKSVNDTLGHPAGDALLCQVGRQIQLSVRPQDLVARLGGDEFAILLTGLADPASATAIATQMSDRLRAASFLVQGIGLGIEASIGVLVVPAQGTELDVVLSRVDVAMYRAKRTGASVAIYDEALDHHDVRDLSLLGELRRAIDNDELTLHYQPKANARDHRITGVESLVRWQHPTRGLLAPDEFIPLAESTGLLGPLTQWVLARAIADAALWERGGMPLAVAVNVSPRSLLTGDLTTTIIDLLATHGLSSRLLEIEVTETAIMTDPDGASRVLRQLRAVGIRISIDDFGSGYTSLAYLKTLPVDTLKIDRIFITDLVADDRGIAVTQSIIDLGHRLGLTVLAEGVETTQTWNQLAALGCDEIQGYLLAHPMPAEHIEGWITTYEHARTDLPAQHPQTTTTRT